MYYVFFILLLKSLFKICQTMDFYIRIYLNHCSEYINYLNFNKVFIVLLSNSQQIKYILCI